MADEADISQKRMEQEEEMRERIRKSAPKRERAELCVECDAEIPSARQEATGGTDICCLCLEKQETKRKHYR